MSMCDDNILSSCQHFSMSTFHHLIWGALKKGHNTLFNFNGTSNIHNGDFNFKNRDPSVPNSSYGLIFVKIQAKYGHFFGKNMSVIQAKIGAEFKFLWFCCLLVIWSTFNALLTFLPNSSVMRWTCTKSPKYGQNHKNTSVIRAIFHKCRARINTGDLRTLGPYVFEANWLTQVVDLFDFRGPYLFFRVPLFSICGIREHLLYQIQ